LWEKSVATNKRAKELEVSLNTKRSWGKKEGSTNRHGPWAHLNNEKLHRCSRGKNHRDFAWGGGRGMEKEGNKEITRVKENRKIGEGKGKPRGGRPKN